MSEKDIEWLKSVGIDPFNQDEELKAAGVSDDWPVGRGIFIQDDRNFVLLVNFIDHIRIISLSNKTVLNDNFNLGVQRIFKLIKTFEKLAYATDPYLGNLTVRPNQLGTGMKISMTFNLASNETRLDKELAYKLENDDMINYKRINSTQHTMETLKTLGAGYNEMTQMQNFLKSYHKVCMNIDPSCK